MKSFSHTFNYTDESDFVLQMEALLSKLYRMEPMEVIRAKYPHFKKRASAFSMRLKRFKGSFPHKRDGRGITHLRLTPALHQYLSQPLASGARNLQNR